MHFSVDPELVTEAETKDKELLSSVHAGDNQQYLGSTLVLPPSVLG